MKFKPTDNKGAQRQTHKSNSLAVDIEPSTKKIHEQIYKKVIPESVRAITGRGLSIKSNVHPALRKRTLKKADSHSEPEDSPSKK